MGSFGATNRKAIMVKAPLRESGVGWAAMDAETLDLALETAKRSGMTPREALIHWDLAGGVASGEQSVHWAIIAIDLAMSGRGGAPAAPPLTPP
jgi:hypothetical protein